MQSLDHKSCFFGKLEKQQVVSFSEMIARIINSRIIKTSALDTVKKQEYIKIKYNDVVFWSQQCNPSLHNVNLEFFPFRHQSKQFKLRSVYRSSNYRQIDIE